MKGKLLVLLLSGLSLLFVSPVYAHIDESGEGIMGVLMHLVAGPDHLPMLIFVVIGVAYLIRKQRRQDD